MYYYIVVLKIIDDQLYLLINKNVFFLVSDQNVLKMDLMCLPLWR